MAGKDLALFGGKGAVAIPSYITEAFTETNIVERETTPSLTLRGKVWSITANGETSQVLKRDEDGEEVPVPALMVAILDYAKQRGRSYYEGSFDPDNTAPPRCWSADSVAPDVTVDEPINPKCQGCPMSAKGSRMNGDKPTVACSQYRILAVVPVKRLDMPPLRFRIAITSDYDGQSKDLQAQGRWAFSNYLDFIKGNGVLNVGSIVTRISFDPSVAYPKVLFQAARFLSEAETATIREMQKSDGLTAILGTSHLTPEQRKSLPKPEAAAAGATTQATVDAAAAEREAQRLAAAEAEKARLAAEAEAEKKRKAEEAKAAKAAEKKRKEDEAAAAAKAAAAKTAEANPGAGAAAAMADAFSDDDEEGSQAAQAAPAAAPAAATKAAAPTKAVTEAVTLDEAETPEGLNGLLDSWATDE